MSQPLTSFEARLAALRGDLAQVQGPSERLALLVERARQSTPPPQSLRAPENLVEGCLAKLWIACIHHEGRCQFICDSESLVVKAIAHALCDLHSGCTSEEVLAADPASLAPLGIAQHLTPNRRNALSHVIQRLRHLAALPDPSAHGQ